MEIRKILEPQLTPDQFKHAQELCEVLQSLTIEEIIYFNSRDVKKGWQNYPVKVYIQGKVVNGNVDKKKVDNLHEALNLGAYKVIRAMWKMTIENPISLGLVPPVCLEGEDC